eukprot:TRINITY_DN18081_c0_g1_i1.p2 TRINITY_DN18081_c0_g1~~TRINITY_DN18081_c0_g1_i1.p2  ORF type:complete len:209 (-),score=-11.01 TRINITY_DN18081_c0_g1_i1:134-694(-)
MAPFQTKTAVLPRNTDSNFFLIKRAPYISQVLENFWQQEKISPKRRYLSGTNDFFSCTNSFVVSILRFAKQSQGLIVTTTSYIQHVEFVCQVSLMEIFGGNDTLVVIYFFFCYIAIFFTFYYLVNIQFNKFYISLTLKRKLNHMGSQSSIGYQSTVDEIEFRQNKFLYAEMYLFHCTQFSQSGYTA